jgi:hypothetical protein
MGMYQVLERVVFVFVFSTLVRDVCHMLSVLFRIRAVFSLCFLLDLGEFRSGNVLLGSWCCVQEPRSNYQLTRTHTV